MLEPGKMDFCRECKYYEEVEKCTHPYFVSSASKGPIGSGGPGGPVGGGGPGGGGGGSILVPGGGPGIAKPPVYDCPYFEKK